MATLEQMTAAIAAQIAPLKAGARLYRRAGRTAVFIDLGSARRWISAAQYAALGQPGYDDLDASDPFWTLPVIGTDTDL
jgi:hypothetical protein